MKGEDLVHLHPDSSIVDLDGGRRLRRATSIGAGTGEIIPMGISQRLRMQSW